MCEIWYTPWYTLLMCLHDTRWNCLRKQTHKTAAMLALISGIKKLVSPSLNLFDITSAYSGQNLQSSLFSEYGLAPLILVLVSQPEDRNQLKLTSSVLMAVAVCCRETTQKFKHIGNPYPVIGFIQFAVKWYSKSTSKAKSPISNPHYYT